MGDSPRRGRYSDSPSPRRRYSRSRSPVRRYSRSPDRKENGNNEDASNPGNNLYVTGLSTRVTEKDLHEHFSLHGKVLECRLVVDPRSHESRGFGFVTMENTDDAERCIKYLNRSTLESRIITVEKAKRKRARTPTPGAYLGVRAAPRGSTRSYGRDYDRERDRDRDGYSSRHSPRYSPYRGSRERDRERSPRHSSRRGHGRDRSRSRSRSPQYSPYRR